MKDSPQSNSGLQALVPADSKPLAVGEPVNPFGRAIVVPKLVADAGARAAKSFANFFGSIANDNTRAAYQRACHCFFAWCEANGLDELAAIEPIHVGAYLKSMADSFEKPTIKQHLAAIRMLFDYLVVGQVLALNPAHAVPRAEARHQARQDAGPHAARGTPAARLDRHVDAHRAAR